MAGHDRVGVAMAHPVLAFEPVDLLHVLQALQAGHQVEPVRDRLASEADVDRGLDQRLVQVQLCIEA